MSNDTSDGVERAFRHAGFLATQLMREARQDIPGIVAAWQRPSVLYRPSIVRDGNKWCALYGSNLVDGVCGYGDTPEQAMADFDRNWREQRITVAATAPEVVAPEPAPEPEPVVDPEKEARDAWAKACRSMTRETGDDVRGDGWKWWGGYAFESTRAPIVVRSDGCVQLNNRLICTPDEGWAIPSDHPVRVEAERVVAAANERHDEKARALAADREARAKAAREQMEADLAAVSAMLTGEVSGG